MKFERWKNKYIDLLATKPDHIFALNDLQSNLERRAFFDARCQAFQGIILEPCSGSGGHLIELAQRHSNQICIGIELRFKRAFRTVEKAEHFDLNNLIVIQGDASGALPMFAPSSVDLVCLNFPDPWDRQRWKKHRILSQEFVSKMYQLLRPLGQFRYKTDHAEYFQESFELIKNQPGFEIKALTRDLHTDNAVLDNILTEFERLFISKGKPICYLCAEKLGEQLTLEV